MTREAVIVDCARSAFGKRKGALAGWHPTDLLGLVLRTMIERNDLDPLLVDDVVGGCVTQAGEQGCNVTRNAWVAAGLPWSVPATSVDRQCGSSQQSAHFVAQGVIAGAYDIAIAAGVEVMSRVPMGASMGGGFAMPMGARVCARYAAVGGMVPQGISAEMIADKWGLSREDLDAFAVESHKRAARAREEGRFANEIIPVKVKNASGEETDEVFDYDE